MRILHFAPEHCIKEVLSHNACRYEAVDIAGNDVDCVLDIRGLPFPDDVYDLVYASHVLEHVDDDERAILEIKRVLRAGGVAILPVPVISEHTIEYDEPNPYESYHVRAPGRDYFEKYARVFEGIKIYSSDDFPEKFQTYLNEDRSKYPTPTSPYRHPMTGKKHCDFVPVCIG